MKTNLLDIVSNALNGKTIMLRNKYGEYWKGEVTKLEKKAYGFGDVGIFITNSKGNITRLDFTDQIEILLDEKQA